ncbi:hypothetical protein F6455_13455 [Proteobacteria bacterium 005FR1]|nr:hypothetical protein [Proteobacteria bacterium 005FR1]
MGEIVSLVGIALLPSAGMLIGALTAHWTRLSGSVMGAVLHGAAGVAVAVVSVELMPRILDDIAPWQLVAGFVLGAAASVAMMKGVNRVAGNLAAGKAKDGIGNVYLPVAVDLFGDGLMIGIGSAVSGGLGFMLALSQVVANIPGGFAATAHMRDKGVSAAARWSAIGSLVVPVFVGAGLGFWLLRGQSAPVQNAALSFVVGMLLLATIEDLVPEADEPQADRSVTTAAFATGFIFFALIALYLG